MSPDQTIQRFGAGRIALCGVKLAGIAAFLLLTNSGFLQRVLVLHGQQRWVALIGFVGLWGLSVIALLIAAFQHRRWLRFFWAVVFSVTTAIGFTYRQASGNELGVLDALSLWNARHEATRAAEFYSADVYWLIFIAIVGIVIFTVPPVARAPWARRWLKRLALVPALPAVAIAVIMLVKEGGGAESLPTQYAPLSIGFVLGTKVVAAPLPDRQPVAWTWRGPFAGAAPRGETAPPDAAAAHAPAIHRIVLLIDESVRGDYIDWTPGNPYTPELARLKDRIVDFGPAASGGNCSHYSNAILRFAASQDGLGRKLLSTPTLWQYAKKAGFRTVYIDGQAGFVRSPGKLQNFMTAEETRDIDGFYALDENTPAPNLDDRLLDIVKKEVVGDKPVLVYANKNGAHFPYDMGYPAEARLFRPTMSETAADSVQGRIGSYRNVVRWSVDRIFKRLFDEVSLEDTVVIYTSDHGQNLRPDRLSHCSVEDPDPREGLVPLFVITDNEPLRARLAAAAAESRGHGSHFAIVPTVLELLGFSHTDVANAFGASLLDKSERKTEFTSGDIFGLFADPRRHQLDLGRDYLEQPALMAGKAGVVARGEVAAAH
jgi:lipid A ethanolaminephosphotransferase